MSTCETILAAIKTKLVNANVAAGQIHHTRREQISVLPCVEIEQAGMQSQENVIGMTDHSLTVAVAVLAKGDIPDSAADPVRMAVHAALMADLSLGLGNDVQLRVNWETADPEVDNYDYARIVHRYTVDYRTTTGAF